MPSCESCGAEIVWAETAATGKPIPLDPQTVKGGNIIAARDPERGGKLVATVTGPGGGDRQTHFASCPNAPQHRKSRR